MISVLCCGRASSLLSAGEFSSQDSGALGDGFERSPGEIRRSSSQLHPWRLHRAFVWQQRYNRQVPDDHGPCQHSVHVRIDMNVWFLCIEVVVALVMLSWYRLMSAVLLSMSMSMSMM